MNALRFYNSGYPVTRNLMNELFNNFGINDSQEKSCNQCVAANILENENDFRLEISIPGYSKEDVKISFHKNVLTIQSEKNENSDTNYKFIRREFGVNSFERRFIVPKSVNNDEIKANFNNGILEIVLPKKSEVVENAPMEIAIQ